MSTAIVNVKQLFSYITCNLKRKKIQRIGNEEKLSPLVQTIEIGI
jgi:hypothetical protein